MNKVNPLILILLIIVCTNSATFSITSVSSCTQQSTSGFCLKWQQNGSVVETTSCFPGSVEVYVLEQGKQVNKTMKQIKAGDHILSFDGSKKVYTEVLGWLHKGQEKQADYLKIQTNGGNFMVSAMHNIALHDGSYAFAKDLLNERLHNGQVVTKISNIFAKGVYAPMTTIGNFYVKTADNQKTLAHCFANIRNPTFYQPFVKGIWQIWSIFGSSSQEQIHPAASFMMNTFSFLLSEE